MPVNYKTYLGSKKATSAAVGTAATSVSPVVANAVLPEGSPWWAYVIMAVITAAISIFHIFIQGGEDKLPDSESESRFWLMDILEKVIDRDDSAENKSLLIQSLATGWTHLRDRVDLGDTAEDLIDYVTGVEDEDEDDVEGTSPA